MNSSSFKNLSQVIPNLKELKIWKVLFGFSLTVVIMAQIVSVFLIRDIEIVARINYGDSSSRLSLYDEKLVCADLPACFRVGHKLTLGAVEFVLRPVSWTTRALEAGSLVDLNAARRLTQNLGPFVTFRAIVVLGIGMALVQFLGERRSIYAVSFAILVWCSGLPIRLIGATYLGLREWLGTGLNSISNLEHHLSRQSTAYILEYDMAALVVVLWITLIISRFKSDESWMLSLAISFGATLFFEHLGLVVLIANLYFHHQKPWRTKIKISVPVIIGWLLPIVSLLIVRSWSSAPGADLFETANYYYVTNRQHFSVIMHFYIFFLVLPFFLGLVTARLVGTLGWKPRGSVSDRRAVRGVFLGLTLTYFVGFFNSGIASEFGRQSLGGQVLAIIAGYLTRDAVTSNRLTLR